jgi:hypothetical protein
MPGEARFEENSLADRNFYGIFLRHDRDRASQHAEY